MSQTINPNVVKYTEDLKRDPLPPDLKDLLTQKAAADLEVANLPAGHPTLAAKQARQASLAAAIAAHPRKNLATVND